MNYHVSRVFVKELGAVGAAIYMSLCHHDLRYPAYELEQEILASLRIDPDEYRESIQRLLKRGLLVACGDDYECPEQALLKRLKVEGADV